MDVDGNGSHRHIAGGYGNAQGDGGSNFYNTLTHFDWRQHDKFTNFEGWHGHGAAVRQHRHWIKARVTHGGGGLDGRNEMTSGTTSTQPKFITVLYVMRIK